MFKLNTKFDADSLLYSLSHFECDSHTVHMLTQRHLPPPLTSTVKSSLFMHGHSSPLYSAARLQRCCTNLSRYMNTGWIFSGQTSYNFYLQGNSYYFCFIYKKTKLQRVYMVFPRGYCYSSEELGFRLRCLGLQSMCRSSPLLRTSTYYFKLDTYASTALWWKHPQRTSQGKLPMAADIYPFIHKRPLGTRV